MRKILFIIALLMTIVTKAEDPVFRVAIVTAEDNVPREIPLTDLAAITFDATKMYLVDANDNVIAYVALCDLDKISFAEYGSGIEDIINDPDASRYNQGDGIYKISGIKVSGAEGLRDLPAGIYIIKRGAEIQKILHR